MMICSIVTRPMEEILCFDVYIFWGNKWSRFRLMKVFQLTPLHMGCQSSVSLKMVLWNQHLLSNHWLSLIHLCQHEKLLGWWGFFWVDHVIYTFSKVCRTGDENNTPLVLTVWHGQVEQCNLHHLYLTFVFFFLHLSSLSWWNHRE